jgi:hypothetical protein
MTIVRNIPSQLILTHAPWFLGGWLIVSILACAAVGLTLVAAGEPVGLITVLIGGLVPLGIFALAIKRDQVIFDGTGQTVIVQRRTLRTYASTRFALHTVHRAEVETLADTARTILVFENAMPNYPLVEAYVSGNGPQRAADTINNWLRHARGQVPA